MIISNEISQTQKNKYNVFHLWSLNSIVTKNDIYGMKLSGG